MCPPSAVKHAMACSDVTRFTNYIYIYTYVYIIQLHYFILNALKYLIYINLSLN